jgi:hypothetical protein
MAFFSLGEGPISFCLVEIALSIGLQFFDAHMSGF